MASPYRRTLEEFPIPAQTGRQEPAPANAVSTQTIERNGAIERAAGPHGRLQSVETLAPQHRIGREQFQRAIAVDRGRENVGRNRGEEIGQRTAMSAPGVAAIQRSVLAIARVMRSNSSRRDCSSGRRVTSVV